MGAMNDIIGSPCDMRSGNKPARRSLNFRPTMPATAPRQRRPAAGNASAELPVRFGANPRGSRHRSKLTQDEVAGRTAFSQLKVSDVEKSVHNVTLETMAVLAHAVGVEVGNLLRPPEHHAR